MELYQYMCFYAVVIIDHWEKWLLHVWRESKVMIYKLKTMGFLGELNVKTIGIYAFKVSIFFYVLCTDSFSLG